MMNQEKLLQDLFSLRETIKNQAKLKGEKSPMVCSDHAIHEMAGKVRIFTVWQDLVKFS